MLKILPTMRAGKVIVSAVFALLLVLSMALPALLAAPEIPKEIPIGVVVDLTGPLASTGRRIRNAILMAEEEINAYMATLGIDSKVKFYIEDDKTDPEITLKAVQSLAARGIKVIIGPEASSGVEKVKSFVDANRIVLISPSSTAVALAIPDDMIFRFVPTDLFQSKALAKLAEYLGKKKVAVIYRGDPWGEGLFLGFKEEFEKLGGVVEGVKYDPNARELSAEVRRLSEIVKGFGAGPDVAVLMISFEDDGVAIVNAAKDDPVLMSVEWMGTDGTANMDKVAKQVGDVLVKVGGLKSTLFAPAKGPKFFEFVKKFKEKYGEVPEAYPCNAYDAAWVVVLTILQVGKYDGEAIAKALPLVAEKYYGVSGWTLLDENGDRAGGDYEIWAIVEEDGKYVWKVVGYYSFTEDKVTITG